MQLSCDGLDECKLDLEGRVDLDVELLLCLAQLPRQVATVNHLGSQEVVQGEPGDPTNMGTAYT